MNSQTTKMPPTTSAKTSGYFTALGHALDGLDTYLREDQSPLYNHDLIGAIVTNYLTELRNSLTSWEHKVSFAKRFAISQTESGFPAFQNVLDLENDRKGAEKRLLGLPGEDEIRQDMVDFILAKKQFPEELQKFMAERCYLQAVQEGVVFSPLVLPKTIRVSVNPKTGRPYYVVHWGYYDGSANLPMVYMATIEDSSDDITKKLVGSDGKLNSKLNIPLPVGGLLNPELAHRFDDFCEKNSSYSLTLSTIGTNLDKDFEMLHPKQIRRFVLGPFYHAAFTRHGEKVDRILQGVKRQENAWLMTWTVQELFSANEQPAKWGLWGGEPAREEFFIDTENLDCARNGVSTMERHALVPHEAYQAIYASGQQDEIFDGYQSHVISGGQVLRNM